MLAQADVHRLRRLDDAGGWSQGIDWDDQRLRNTDRLEYVLSCRADAHLSLDPSPFGPDSAG